MSELGLTTLDIPTPLTLSTYVHTVSILQLYLLLKEKRELDIHYD